MRRELVEVAAEVFQELGYHGASLRQIASRAGTTQAVLYRYFSSKSDLFKASVVEPFEVFLADLLRGWRDRPVDDFPSDQLVVEFTSRLYDFAVEHRRLILTLISTDSHSDEDLDEVKWSLAAAVKDLSDRVVAEQDSRHWNHVDVEIAAPVTICMIICSAVLDRWLFMGDQPSRERVIAELVRYERAAMTEPAV